MTPSSEANKGVGFDAEKNDIKRTTSVLSSDSSAESISVRVQIAKESEHEIKYRTCSWQKVPATCLYTSLILGRFCIKHPEMRDVCDIGQYLFGGSQLAYNLTATMFILNNVFVQALHVITGAKYLNTVSNSAECSLTFGVCVQISLLFHSSMLSSTEGYYRYNMFLGFSSAYTRPNVWTRDFQCHYNGHCGPSHYYFPRRRVH
ncbi:hypothetical protein F5890DRAFT_1407176 [Lentinula detonsa]|uniref:Uncharacterized protein n=1 Tax=Lentinula detonsa TaxID=2804962 RepID=A0AA38Q2U4_9AGAR|nr:hypothetical protein F5890DRAFT_1407176 [Lentinula detonsa]